MNYQITKPRPKETADTKNSDDPTTWTVAPKRGNGKDPKPGSPSIEELQLMGAIPPTIVVNGLRVVQKQKIAILTQQEINALKTARIKEREVPVTIVRKTDCPNPDGEYGPKGGPPTYTVLLQFDTPNARVVATNTFLQPGETTPTVQANNFLLNDNPAPQRPTPPPRR